MRQLIPQAELFHKLTQLASEPDPTDLDHAFWGEEHDLSWAVQDGMEALMLLAKDEDIGWMLNAGWRCDVSFELYGIDVCCNRHRFGEKRIDISFQIQATTPQGALAAGILAVLQARAQQQGRRVQGGEGI
ncbi:MAG: hypothetical protein AB7F35_00695 [Acetobacteraceae bacterium]